MIVVVLENASNFVITIYDKVAKAYEKSSMARIRKSDKQKDVVARFTRPPLFNSGWLLDCDKRVSSSTIKALEKAAPNNRIIIRVTNQKDYLAVQDSLQDTEIVAINNFVPDQAQVVDWISTELPCDRSSAQTIYDRCNGRMSEIMNAVSLLASIGRVTEVDIKQVTKKQKNLGVNDLFLWIIGRPRRAMKREDAIRIIYKYRYAYKWLSEYLVEELDKYIEIFSMILSGELSLMNFREVRQQGENSILREVSDWQLQKIVEQFEFVSLEYLVYVRELLASFEKNSRLFNDKLIKIVDLGG